MEQIMQGATSTVLVVDGEQRLRDLVRGYLEREGFTVLSAADGPSALDLAAPGAAAQPLHSYKKAFQKDPPTGEIVPPCWA